MIERYALAAVAGYLVGSIPFGLYADRYGLRRGGLPVGFATANVASLGTVWTVARPYASLATPGAGGSYEDRRRKVR